MRRHDPLIVGVLFTLVGEGMPRLFRGGVGARESGAAKSRFLTGLGARFGMTIDY